MNETQRALMEGARNAASDEYFGARPQIDCTDRRRVFEAGFDRAWKELLPVVCDCTTETHADGRQETYCSSDQMMRNYSREHAALEMIAGKRQCLDNLLSNAEIAEQALTPNR